MTGQVFNEKASKFLAASVTGSRPCENLFKIKTFQSQPREEWKRGVLLVIFPRPHLVVSGITRYSLNNLSSLLFLLSLLSLISTISGQKELSETRP